jgi:circadian clock protein KaiC
MPLTPRVTTGVGGLDEILGGGLPRNRIHLLQGDPGSGKTTLALQFLLQGRSEGELGLYVSLSETDEEIRAVAASHGWNLDGIELYDLSAIEAASGESREENTLFQASEIDLHETTERLIAEVERIKPTRVVFDSLSELRLLAQSALRYRRQILALKQYFAGRKCTVLFLDDRTSEPGDLQLQSLAHGVVLLEQSVPAYGVERRRMRVLKMRGVKFRGGYHDFMVLTGGIEIYPRVVAKDHVQREIGPPLKSGDAELDALLGGGLDRGTSTLIVGPAGAGKSVISTKFIDATARRGERCVLFTFEEGSETLFRRSAALGMDLRGHVESGKLLLRSIDPAEVSPGEFDHLVRQYVEKEKVSLVSIDSLNGYLTSMPEEHFLTLQMHELLSYLNRSGVATLMIMAQHGLLGASMAAPVDVSYLADGVVLLRFFEASGSVRRAISVTKRRGGAHEDTIRELSMSAGRIDIGKRLVDFHGVLTGVPTFTGALGRLSSDSDDGPRKA